MRRNALERSLKRPIDLVGAGVGLVVLAPALALIAIATRITLGRPVLFRQVRPGMGGRPFTIVKFRTMRLPRGDEVWFQTDEVRLGRVGRFLRSTSLDELPELWNVLRGDMSLVGPRPLLMEYLNEYSPEERRRHEVRPGVTGWAAVNGRHRLPFRERLRLDTWYVDHWSLWLDMRIMGMTIAQLFRRKDTDAVEDPRLNFPMPGEPWPRDESWPAEPELIVDRSHAPDAGLAPQPPPGQR